MKSKRGWLISYLVLLTVLGFMAYQAGLRHSQQNRWEKCWDKNGIVSVNAEGKEICMLPPWGMETRKEGE